MSHSDNKYQDLLDCVKKAVPFLQGVEDQQFIALYKDPTLQTYINIDRNNSLRVSEAFRKASPSVGSFDSNQAFQGNTTKSTESIIKSFSRIILLI